MKLMSWEVYAMPLALFKTETAIPTMIGAPLSCSLLASSTICDNRVTLATPAGCYNPIFSHKIRKKYIVVCKLQQQQLKN